MDVNLYKEIVSFIQKHTGLTLECLTLLKEKYPSLHPGTLASIVAQEFQKKIKQINYKNTVSPDELYGMYKEMKEQIKTPDVLINLAIERGLAPTLAARIVVKKYYEEQVDEDDDNVTKPSKKDIAAMIKDTTLIEDKNLAYEVFICTLSDDQYSPAAETMKHTLGQQYEIRLHRHLEQLGIAFKDEDSLRKYGYDKTPDIKLDVPVAVNGFIINWIESKALFGDEENHRNYVKDQYSSYWNRFGPGMVIYWFGYLETIKDPSEKRFIIMNDIPENYEFLQHSKSIS